MYYKNSPPLHDSYKLLQIHPSGNPPSRNIIGSSVDPFTSENITRLTKSYFPACYEMI